MMGIMRPAILAVALAFGAVGCVQQGKPPAPKETKPVAAADKDKAPTPTAHKPGARPDADANEPVKPDASKPTPPPPPPPPEMPVTKNIEAEKVGLPIYPGAEALYAREYRWTERKHVSRMATLSSEDAPDKIVQWYRAKLGKKAEVERKTSPGDQQWVRVSLFEPRTRTQKSVMVSWREETPGEATAIRIQLTVRTVGATASK